MDRQIAILISAMAIIGFAIALYKNRALTKKSVIAVVIVAGGLGIILAATL